MCDIIPKTSENCAPPNGGSRGGLQEICGPLLPHCLLLRGYIKEGADTNCPKRQSALNYKSLQTALCARCGVMRRHLSRFSPVWGRRVWKTLRATQAESSQEEKKKWRINTLICAVAPCQDSVRCWRSWTFNAFVDILTVWLTVDCFLVFFFFSPKGKRELVALSGHRYCTFFFFFLASARETLMSSLDSLSVGDGGTLSDFQRGNVASN